MLLTGIFALILFIEASAGTEWGPPLSAEEFQKAKTMPIVPTNETNLEQLYQGEDKEDEESGVSSRIYLQNGYMRWPEGVVPYAIAAAVPESLRLMIAQAIEEIEAASCVTFVPRTDETAYVGIKNDSPGCSATLGRKPSGGLHNLNLGPGCETNGIIVHEFLHNLGCLHEFTRPDRDDHVTVFIENVEEGKEHNFIKAHCVGTAPPGEREVICHSDLPYDLDSVMHYYNRAFGIRDENGVRAITITANNGATGFGSAQMMSPLDIQKLRRAYECDEPTGSVSTILVIGGKGKKDVEAYVTGATSNGDCSLIPEAPFVTMHALGLKDNMGRPMICGGSRNPLPKSCYYLENNSWVMGPSLKRKRVGASVTCLDSGECWVFGGKSKSYTEWYDPATGSFHMGVPMPVNSVHGVCTALAPSGLIYMVARKQPGVTKAYTFDPMSMTFTLLTDLTVDKRYSACAVVESMSGGEDFIVVGGGMSSTMGTSTTHIYNSMTTMWTDGPTYPHEVFAATAVPLGESFAVHGGITLTGDEVTKIYIYNAGTNMWDEADNELASGKSFSVAISVEGDACPSPP